MRFTAKLIIAAILLLQAYSSSAVAANLLTNGSFETLKFKGNWTYMTNANHAESLGLGWTWSDGSAMEFWNTPFLGVTADHGTKIAELNAHAGTSQYSFYQNFDTVAGQSYDYSFAYRARSNNSEKFHLGITRYFDDDTQSLIDDIFFGDHIKGQWKTAKGSFVAKGSSSRIGFWSDDAIGDTTGNLLDNVIVTNSVPEPGSLALLALGLIALSASRRRVKAQ